MTKVSLRVYNREIEGMIEGSRLDEAIAHCQHILKTFPMYIETYRLLGKTFLEARKYTDAADIFQRALMAVPDDFVSHVGMSIIRDDEGKLDDAIWHMERAFEVQPSNSAIQGELRRLYGRRDGVEPPKIRLSRDALANMYSQGELFNQAIAEIRSVLADDPNRPDLQAMLARANYRAGQKVEAAEMAAGLLKKYPYCMDALRVLVDVLPGTTKSENTQIYRHRLGMLDPYSIFATDSVFASDQVADNAVNLERLEYKPGAMPTSAQPDWASSLGIQLAGEKKAENTPPAWLDSSDPSGEQTPVAPEPAAPAPAGGDDSLPEWMRSAGWQESTGANQEIPEDSSQEPPSESIAQANIPEWLKSMAPAEVTEVENAPSETPSEPQAGNEEDIPDWLKSMAPTAAGAENVESETIPSEAAPAITEPEPAQDSVLPDWMQSLAPTKAEIENVDSEPVSAETPPTNIEPEPAQEGTVPDWLQSLAPTPEGVERVESVAAPHETSPANIEPEPAQEGDVPDWLQSLAPAETAVEKVELEAVPLETSPSISEPEPAQESAVPDWLKSLAPATGGADNIKTLPVSVEIPPINIEPEPAQEGAIPDWLQSLAPAGTENIEVEPALGDTTPAITEFEPAQEGAMPDWLQSIAPAAAGTENIESEPAPIETPLTHAEFEPAEEETMPDWLQSMKPREAGMDNMKSKSLPVEPQPANSEPEPAEEASFPDWLKSISPTGAGEAENTETTPTPVASQHASIEPEPAEEGSFPDWLKSIAPPATTEMENAETTPTPVAPQPINAEHEPKDIELPDTQPTPTVKIHTVEVGSSSEPEGTFPDWLSSPGESAEAEKAMNFDVYTPETVQPEVPPASMGANGGETVPLAEQPENGKPVSPQPVSNELASPTVSATVSESQGFQPMGEAKPLDIGDDALGWLESLAAKQGANPDELLTKAQDRSEEMPDWLRPTEESTPAPVVSEPLNPLDSLPVESVNIPVEKPESQPVPAVDEVSPEVEVTIPPQIQNEEVAQPVTIEDDTMAWLERLAANQGAKPEEMLTKPENQSETTPEWIQNASLKQPVPTVEIPESTKPETPEAPSVSPEDDVAVDSWLNTLDKPEAPIDIPATAPVEEEFHSPSEELPDWLKDLEKPLTPEPKKQEESETDIPDWLRQPAEPVSQEPTQAPSVPEPVAEPTPEPDMPAWMMEPEETSGPAVPTAPDEWIPVDKTAAEAVFEPTQEKPPVEEPVSPPVDEPAQRQVIKGTGMLARIPSLNKNADSLSAAQSALDNNALAESMNEYGKLIKKGRLLEEVIHDLREAIYRFPVDVIVWQTLGDAYMRANRLQDALDAYTKAEELLR